MKNRQSVSVADWMPIIIFVVIAAIFGIATKGTIFTPTNLTNIFNQSLATIIAALGMVFVASMGGTDITHGSLVALATALGSMAAAKGGVIWLVPVIIFVGAASGLLIGTINARFKVPSFMTSLALLIAYRALVNLLLSSTIYKFPQELSFFGELWFEVVAVIILIIIITYVFHYTPFGTYVRAIGENENSVRFSGINVEKVKIIAFVISGVMAAIAGIFLTARIGGTNNTLGSGFEMKVMMAMFIGGIPVQGGMGSKLYKLVIGAPTIILLENGLVLCGADGAVTQLIRGIVLLLVIYITMQVNERFRYGHKPHDQAI